MPLLPFSVLCNFLLIGLSGKERINRVDDVADAYQAVNLTGQVQFLHYPPYEDQW